MTSSGLTIRPIEKEDFDELYAIDQACFEPGVAYSRSELRWFLSRKGAFGFVAQLTGDSIHSQSRQPIVGFILAWKQANRLGHIITLDVLDQFRRKTIGTQLMNRASKEFTSSGVRLVVLEVSVKNAPAQAFYRKFGFQMVDRLRNYYSNGEDALALEAWFEV